MSVGKIILHLHHRNEQTFLLTNLNIMKNTFTVHFKNALGEFKTEDMVLPFHSVQEVSNWFEDTLGLRAKSISKH